MENSKTNLILGILIGALVLTSLLFGILWYQARSELRSKNQEVRVLEQQLKERAQVTKEAETMDTSDWKT